MPTLPPGEAGINAPPRYDDLLTPTRTHASRGVKWQPHPADAGCPCCGTLEVYRSRKPTAYTLTEFPVGRGYGSGRAFELRKDDGTTYHLFLADDLTLSTCDCPGFSYAGSARADRRHGDHFETLGCVHLDAIDALVNFNRWLPDPRCHDEQDAGPTETPERIDPADLQGGF